MISIHDAIEAGFNHVVFIIRKDIEQEFKEVIGERIKAICSAHDVGKSYYPVTIQYMYDLYGETPEPHLNPQMTILEYIADKFGFRVHIQQNLYEEKQIQNQKDAYISTNSTFDAMPDELYILLVVERENEVYSHECPFNTIFITGMSNTDILGRYCAEDVIGDDCLLHYRKYVKDKTATSGLCILYMQHEENTVFYHANPYFDVETILKSDDDDFKNRVSLPF